MNIGWQGLVILVVVIVAVFGATELGALTRSLHKAQQEFRHHARTARPAREHPEDIDEK